MFAKDRINVNDRQGDRHHAVSLGRPRGHLAGLTAMIAAVAGILLGAPSCIFEYPDIDTQEETVGQTPMTMGIRLAALDPGEGYQVGTLWENAIDIQGGDYRIYFFTNEGGNDKYIASFYPKSVTALDEDGSYYSMEGVVPATLLEYSSFKIIILANWGRNNYPRPDVGTTIDDICSYGIFSFKDDFNLGEGNLIPFYGVQEYTGVEFKADKVNWMDNPVNMLRAMAKIEVVFVNSDLELQEVALHRYNERGYCAPEKVYSSSDYVGYSSSYGWRYLDDEFDVHLLEQGNDADQSGRVLPMQLTRDGDGNNVWFCYVPEYDNTDDLSDYAYIQLERYGHEADLEEYRIYFRNYNSNGTAAAGADYNICRNVLYRFYVTLNGMWLSVFVDKWEDSFHNDFIFGGGD